MKVIEITEMMDGGAEVVVEFTKEELAILLNDSVNRALKNYIEEIEERS